MKTFAAQLTYLLGEQEVRRNIRALLRYLGIIVAVVLLHTVLFQVIMWTVEGQDHSWVSALYWTLVTMSTLGFGDITFASDIGRAFSLVVVVSGVVLLLVLLPFTFIRFFFAPWLEAQVKSRAPRQVPEGTEGHVIVCAWDSIAPGLVERLELRDIPYFMVEPDPARAARMSDEGISVVTGELESKETWVRLGAERARLILVNAEDTVNTNIVMTVREVAPEVPVAGVAAVEDSVDILELAGCTEVLPLKQRLGEHLANRVDAGHAKTHVIGSFEDMLIAEVPVHGTPLVGKTLREIRFREEMGLNVLGVWEQARLLPPRPDTRLSDMCMPVVVGSKEQIEELDEFLHVYDVNVNPVLIIGGGKVGRSAGRTLRARGVPVHIVEKKEELRERIGDIPERLFIGDAASRELLAEAGIEETPSVLLTTNDDAMNIYLAVYCRRLRPDARIVSRITHERNMEAIRRAGVDLALSYASLGVETVWALLQNREPVFLGEGVGLHRVDVPEKLAGKSLEESGIGARTGLNVVMIREDGRTITNPGASTTLPAAARIVMIGDEDQLREFVKEFG